MQNQKLEPASIETIAKGALTELFAKGASKVAANIADSSTDATAIRKIVLEVRIKPDPDRVGLTVTTTSNLKLAAVSQHVSRAYVGKDNKGGALLFSTDPRQMQLWEAPEPDANLLTLPVAAQE